MEIQHKLILTSLIMELYSDAMSSQIPVSVVCTIFEVAENGHRHVQTGELFPAHRAEPTNEINVHLFLIIISICTDLESFMALVTAYSLRP